MLRTTTLLAIVFTAIPPLFAQPDETAPRRPAKYHYRQDSPERIKIEKALDTIIEPGVVLKGNPWQLMEALGKHFDIETGVDEPSLLAEGVSDERMPEFELPSGITLQQALDTVFAESEIQFDCHIRFDVLELTPRIRADDFMETVVYELRDLPHEVLSTAGKIEELIQSHTGYWLDQNSGEGTLESIPGGVVIRQTQRRHREILNLLTRLREFNTGPPLTITVSDLPTPRGERKSPQLEAIRDALAGPPPEGVEAVKTVGELCAFLDNAYPFHVRLNERSINPEGIGPETEVRVRRLNTLNNTLGYAISDVGGLELNFITRNSVLSVESIITANEDLYLEVYDLAGLIEELRSDPTYLFPVFENAKWLFNTDLGSPPGAVTEYQGCLLFTGTDSAHQEMRNVFQQLREFSAQQGYPKPVIPEPAEPQNFGDSFGEPPPDTNFF